MTDPSSSQFANSQTSLASQTSSDQTADAPIPFPEESPFLSDHDVGTPNPPPTARQPIVTPAELSQFPPTAVAHSAASAAPPRPSVQEPSSNHPAFQGSPPGGVQDALSSFTLYGATDDPYNASRGSQAVPRTQAQTAAQTELMDRLKSILATTTDSLQGRLVEQYLGIVSAEALVPTDILLEGAERTGRFSRYKTSQQKLKSLEQLTLAELKMEADKLGGNAVVGLELRVSMDHGVVLIVATGTAVRVV